MIFQLQFRKGENIDHGYRLETLQPYVTLYSMVYFGIELKQTTQYDFLSETANQLLSKRRVLVIFHNET